MGQCLKELVVGFPCLQLLRIIMTAAPDHPNNCFLFFPPKEMTIMRMLYPSRHEVSGTEELLQGYA